jgi:hypothetical protein
LDYQLFYDHARDPHELDNLFYDPDFENKRKQLESELINLARKTGDPILPRLEATIQKNTANHD